MTKAKENQYTNLIRVKMELDLQSDDYIDSSTRMYMVENGLEPDEIYVANNSNKRKVYMTVRDVLVKISNNPRIMKEYKTDEMSVTKFYDNLLNRIDRLDRQIRMMPTGEDDTAGESDVFGYFFSV